jgi:hypothetical protein
VKLMMFAGLLQQAVAEGLVAAALVDRDGNTIDLAGEITDDEAMPLAAVVMYRLKSADLAARLFAGEIVALDLDGRDVAVGIARRQLFIVVVLPALVPTALALVAELRDAVAARLPGDTTVPPPWRTGGGDSGAGPAELPVIELGVTVRRKDLN